MEIKSTKQFWSFITAFLLAGAAWLAISYRAIERIIKGRKK